MDVKQTIKNIHDRFPELEIDDILNILDCIAEPMPVIYTTDTSWKLGPVIS